LDKVDREMKKTDPSHLPEKTESAQVKTGRNLLKQSNQITGCSSRSNSVSGVFLQTKPMMKKLANTNQVSYTTNQSQSHKQMVAIDQDKTCTKGASVFKQVKSEIK